jgi:hypothetical protein
MKNPFYILVTTALIGLSLACNKGDGFIIKKPDYVTFKNEVHPVLLRDCGFHACHGSSDRFFRVWGIGHVRLDPIMSRELAPPTTQNELDYSEQLAESMIDFKNPSQSLLIRKPLAVEAGGSGHFGSDLFGRNVYRTVNDQGYLVLARWVVSIAQTPATGAAH